MSQLERIREEYPPVVDFDGITIRSCLERCKGKATKTPFYSAGFLLNPNWMQKVYMPRVGASNHREILPMAVMKHGDKLKGHLHKTTSIIHYYDHEWHFFFNLCDNSPENAHTRAAWLERRDEHLHAICEALEFTPQEIEQAQRNFKWYMTTPAGSTHIPPNVAVHGSVAPST